MNARLCEAKTTWGGEFCHAPATAIVVVACEHEHMKERLACEWHRRMSENGEMDCYDCKQTASLLSVRALESQTHCECGGTLLDGENIHCGACGKVVVV